MKKIAFFIVCIMFSCQSPSEENSSPKDEGNSAVATSIGGRALYPLEESEATKSKKDSLLQVARRNYLSDSTNLDNIIWYGRRVAYLYRYPEAIEIFSKGLEHHPESPELYRHRGHRYISTRKFDLAIEDFTLAEAFIKDREIEIEPDGLPNKLNIPLSNLQFNIYYHWALAHYLKGEYDRAAELYEECMKYSVNNDLMTATSDWLYMTYMKLGENEKAAAVLEDIDTDMEIIENASYFQRLLMYRGEIEPKELLDLSNTREEKQLDIVTQGYGVGNYYAYNGDKEKAKEIFLKILECPYWPAFGYIAAEAEIEGGLLTD